MKFFLLKYGDISKKILMVRISYTDANYVLTWFNTHLAHCIIIDPNWRPRISGPEDVEMIYDYLSAFKEIDERFEKLAILQEQYPADDYRIRIMHENIDFAFAEIYSGHRDSLLYIIGMCNYVVQP